MSKWRKFLIRRLAGKHMVMLNTTVEQVEEGGRFALISGGGMAERNTFAGRNRCGLRIYPARH